MKKNNKWLISIISIFVFLCVSCNNFLSKQTEEAVEKTAAAGKTGTLSFTVNGASSRSVLPDTSLLNFSNFVLTGTVEGNSTTQALGSWSSIQEMLSDSITIAAGEWNLVLSAKRDTVDFAAIQTVTVEEGQNATASFKLTPTQTQTGLANITLRFSEKAGISGVSWTFYNSSYDSFWYSSGSEISGDCGKTNSYGGGVQVLTDTSFSLQKELSAGRYMLECRFYTDMNSLDSDYYDYVVIQPGFESVLDYTIDYFEFTGITEAVSTEQGMLLTLDIPKGVEMLSIMRITDYAGLMAAMSDPDAEPIDMTAYITIMNKQFASKTTSQTTLQLLDSYNYKKDDELTYAVYFDLNSFSSVIKTYTALYDGIPAPEFTTYPEFATESNDDGVTTKIKISNNPVLDWKGNEITSGYKLYLNDSSMGETIYPKFAVDGITKEYEIEDGSLFPGQQSFTSYRFGLDKDGWAYSFYLDTSELTGNQLPPVLQGPQPAKATDEGINIILYGNYQESCEMTILRADSPEGPWSVIKANIDCRAEEGFYLDFTDKYDLVAGTTYYYKVRNDYGQTFGGDYFSATATVSKGPFASISTQPVLAVSAAAVATFTSGTFQFADTDDLYYIRTVYEFAEENNPTNQLRIEHTHYLMGSNSDYFQGEYTAQNKEDYSWVRGSDNNMDLYALSADNKKYIFSSAYIRFYDTNGYTIKQLDFTPAQGYCPAEIQIPNKKIGLELIPTIDGIVLNISNIPEGASSLSMLSAEAYDPKNQYNFNYDRSYYFNRDNVTSGTMSFTDKYVNNHKLYYYKVTVEKNGEGSYSSDVVSATATGGIGEIGISLMPECTFDDTNNTITYTQQALLSCQADLTENTYLSIYFYYRANYNEYDYRSGYFYYSGINPDNPVSFESWGNNGTYTPYFASININFPDYSYYQNNVTIPPNSTLPQQVVVQ